MNDVFVITLDPHKDVIQGQNVISNGFDSQQFQSHETLTFVLQQASAEGEYTVKKSSVFEWHRRFKEG